MKKFGLMDPFYFDLMLFLKENHFFSDDKYLLYNFDCISILNESIDSGLIDIALTDKSLLYESDNVGLLSNFMDTPYRLVGVSNFYEKLKDKDHILKVALPIKSNPFKLMIMNFLKSYQARNVKIQWIKYNCSNIEKLFSYKLIDFAIVLEPYNFLLMSSNLASIIPYQVSEKVALSVIYNRKSFDTSKNASLSEIKYFKNSLLKAFEFLASPNSINQFLSKYGQKYNYLKSYKDIFIESFSLNIKNGINKNADKEKDIKIRKEGAVSSLLNLEFLDDKEKIDIISTQLKNLCESIIRKKDGKIYSIPEIKLINIYLRELRNQLCFLKIENKILDDRNKIAIQELQTNREELANLFMQFKETSDQLIIKNIQDQEAVNSKNRFFATITHDLKTPLSGIISITEQLFEDVKEPEARRKLGIVLQSANILLQMLNNMLENSRDINVSQRLEEKVFNFTNLINSIIANINEKIKEKPHVEFKTLIDEDIPEILYGDPLKLNQIVYNLLGNAVKFTSNGYIALIIKLEDRSKDVVKISICIKDTGIGIAEENLQHIFDPFVQENELIKEKYGGTGLGLSIVKEFIELMGGSIHCTSKKNEGTTFSVFLTFSLPKIEEKKEHIESFVDQIVFKNSSLLIIEDNAVNQEIIRSYLKKYDTLKLTICNNGLEGLEKLSKDEYSLVLCDINMPVMNGKEFCIKAKKIYPDLPIIALTAHDSVEEKNELIQLGFNDIISKPYNRTGIIRGITRFIPVKKEINNKNYDETEMNKIEKQENCRNLTEDRENSLESRISTINHEEIDKGNATFVDNSGFSEREKEVFIKLHEYLNNNKELMSYQRLFLTDLLNFYKKLKDGIEKKDKEQLKYFTHNLKGTAPMIGYNEFTDFALEVSNLYKQDRFDELQKYKEIMLSIIEKIVER